MSQIADKMDITVPEEPGIYRVLFPESNPTGHLIFWVNSTAPCMSFVPFPLQIFEDSEKALASDPDIIEATVIAAKETIDANVVEFPRKTAKMS